MLACRLRSGARQGRALVVLTVLAALAAVILPGSAGRASVGSPDDLKQVSYLGYRFTVPRSWPVINVAAHKQTCVRFDQHAVYLGGPGRNQSCPSWLIGTTEAMLVQPAAARSARSSVEDPVARQITVTARRIRITATFDNNPTVIYRILASAKLPAPVIRIPRPPSAASRRPQAEQRRAASDGAERAPQSLALSARRVASTSGPDLPANVTSYHGLGFDSCTAPSTAYMRAWRRRSPYRAIGVYIGGADRACAQPNLTRGWLRREASAGWRFLPMYVGPQAEFGQLHAPTRQGVAAATNAVVQAERYGFPARTPLYYDMESYPARDTGAALRFLSAWTMTLHLLGYRSGVYSSSASGVQDLSRQYFRARFTIPDVIYDALWNGRRNTNDPRVLRADQWADHQRVHQYSGNVRQRFGGDAIDIDQDYLNVRMPSPEGTPQASPAVTQQDGAVDVFYRGPQHRLWYLRYGPVVGWERPADLGGRLTSAPTVVYPGPGELDVFYRGPGGGLWQTSRRPDGRWTQPRRLNVGVIGGAPTAVASASGVVNVFWKGSAGQLWTAQFQPGSGWTSPQRLGGNLALGPSPVETADGSTDVFWTGTDHHLWYAARGLTGSWSRPVRLAMGELGGPPEPTAAPSGVIDVFWRNAGSSQVREASYQPGDGWSAAKSLGGLVSGVPVPLAAAGGRARVFFKGMSGGLWQVVQSAAGRWLMPARMHAQRQLGSELFAAIGGTMALGRGAASTDLFWTTPDGTLWSTSLGSGGDWTRPHNLHARTG
jgi:Domain of unknown function (DUF1906)